MLRNTLGLPDDRIFKLTARVFKGGTTQQPEDQRPSYENMVAAFKNLTARAGPGDQVYIHYSGHGGRTPTLFPKLKGANGLDESLVPTDIYYVARNRASPEEVSTHTIGVVVEQF